MATLRPPATNRPHDARLSNAGHDKELYVVLVQGWADETDEVAAKLTRAGVPWRLQAMSLVPPPGLGAVALFVILVPESLLRAAGAVIAADSTSAVPREQFRPE